MVFSLYDTPMKTRVILACAAASLLASCSTIEKASEASVENRARSASLVEQARRPAPVKAEDTVRLSDGIYLGARSFRARHGMPLPPRLDNVAFDSTEALSLSQIAAELSAIFAMPVLIDEGAAGRGSLGALAGTGSGSGGGSAVGGAEGVSPPPFNLTPSAVTVASAGPVERMFVDRYRGPASGLLDKVAARFGYSWENRDNQIVFFRTVTKTFTLIALPNATNSKSALNSGAETSGESGESNNFNSTASQNVQVESTLTIWSEIETAVKAMVGSAGSVALSPSTGTITVEAPAPLMHRVGNFIREQNARLGRQVAISVQVFSVSDFDTEQYGLDLSVLVDDLSDLGIGFSGVTPAVSAGASALSVGILESSDSGLAGSQALLQLLQRQTRVSLVTSSAVTTMSNAVVPVQVNQTTSYLAEVSTSETEVSTTTSLTPGQVTTGFNLSLLPQILDDQRVTLQFALNLSNLDDLRTIESGDNLIQLPDVSNRAFIQQVMLSSNDTLVLSGFQERRNEIDKAGPVSPESWFLGGENKGSIEEDFLVVLITPVVLDAGAQRYAQRQ